MWLQGLAHYHLADASPRTPTRVLVMLGGHHHLKVPAPSDRGITDIELMRLEELLETALRELIPKHEENLRGFRLCKADFTLSPNESSCAEPARESLVSQLCGGGLERDRDYALRRGDMLTVSAINCKMKCAEKHIAECRHCRWYWEISSSREDRRHLSMPITHFTKVRPIINIFSSSQAIATA